jgi:hypothetical protein
VWFEPSLSGLESGPGSLDLSFLNDAPAGQHGFVRAQGANFVDDRGERLRFFGVGLSGEACLPEAADAERLARTFRRLGLNAVRLLGLDAPGVLLTQEGSIDPAALDRLDRFTAALAAEGLYFSVVLHARGNGWDRVHEPLLVARERFARALLTHDNPFTHRAYREEPALLYVELGNEDTVFPSGDGAGVDDAPEELRAALRARYRTWLAQRTANGERAPGPADQEASGALPTFTSPPAERADYLEFMRTLELESAQRLTRFVRGELGVRSMLLNTQASFGGLAGVLRERALSDFIDVHGHWDANTSQITAPASGTLGAMASYRVYDKPFVVSEYAMATPSTAAAELFPLLVGIAGLQNWDALFGRLDLEQPSQLAFVRTAALAFRRGLVSASPHRVDLSVPERPSALPVTAQALPEMWRAASVPGSAAALRSVGITLRPGSGEPRASHALQPSSTLGSDTGELLWVNDGPHPRFSVDAPALKMVCGRLSETRLELGAVSFEMAAFSPDFACVALVALDGAAVASSRRLLLTVAGDARSGRPARAQYVPFSLVLPSGAWQALPLAAKAQPRALSGARPRLDTAATDAALSWLVTR